MSLYKEQLGNIDRGKRVRRWIKNQLNRWQRRQWKTKGEYADTRKKYKYWAD